MLYENWKKIKSSKTLNIFNNICSVNHNDICNKKNIDNW